MPGSFELAAFATAVTGGALFVARRRLERRLDEAEALADAHLKANEHLWARLKQQELEIAMLNYELDGQEPELEPVPEPVAPPAPAAAPAPAPPVLPPEPGPPTPPLGGPQG
jgi:hypothetical protein